MESIIRRLRSTLSLSASSSASSTTGVAESVAGVEYDLPASHPSTVALHDCAGCEHADECQAPDEHTAYPAYLKLDTTTPLYGQMKPLARHLVVSSGVAARHWPSHVEKVATLAEAESFASNPADARSLVLAGQVTKAVRAVPNAGKWLTCVAERPPAGECLLFPDYRAVHFTHGETADAIPDEAAVVDFVRQLVDSGGSAAELPSESPTGAGWSLRPVPYRAVILICSHTRRDKRCGVVGPLLQQQFEKVLAARRAVQTTTATAATAEAKKEDATSAADTVQAPDHPPDDVGVFLVSHVGGHKFAGNVIIYPAGVWYGRVNTCHVEAIVDRTVFGNEIIRELYRGRLNPPYIKPTDISDSF